MTFNVIAAGDPGAASTAMENWRHVNYGSALLPVDASGVSVDSTIDLGSSTKYFKDAYIDAIYTTGDVGIGTTAPVTDLSVAGTVPEITIQNTEQKTWAADEGIGYLNFYVEDTSGIGARNVASIRAINQGSSASPGADLVFYNSEVNVAQVEAFRISGEQKLSTGGEKSPDCSAGGITLFTNEVASKSITLKDSGDAHGITGKEETDTMVMLGIDNFEGSKHGHFRGLGEGEHGLLIDAFGGTPNSDSDATAYGTLTLNPAVKSGTGITAHGASDNVLVVTTNDTATHIFKGDGDLYIDGTTTAYDDEDDIMLAKTIRDGWKGDLTLDKYSKRLQELGIMSEGGFMSTKKMHSLHLGVVGQLFNIIRGMGQQLGYSEEKLLSMSKEYA